jgi:hypothetical protein
VTAAPQIHELGESGARFVAAIVLDVGILVCSDGQVGLTGVGELPHRCQVGGIEGGKVTQIANRGVLVLLLHVEIARVE